MYEVINRFLFLKDKNIYQNSQLGSIFVLWNNIYGTIEINNICVKQSITINSTHIQCTILTTPKAVHAFYALRMLQNGILMRLLCPFAYSAKISQKLPYRESLYLLARSTSNIYIYIYAFSYLTQSILYYQKPFTHCVPVLRALSSLVSFN